MSALSDQIEGLTDEQAEAIEYPGNLSLLACPGSGKTRVVGLRLASISQEGRRRVAVASYTNVAVEEIRGVVASAGVVLGPRHYVGTLHGLLLDFLVRPHSTLVTSASDGVKIRQDDWTSTDTNLGWPWVKLGESSGNGLPVSYFDWTADGDVVCRRTPTDYNYATAAEVTALGAVEAKKKKTQLLKRGFMTQADAIYVALLLLQHPRLANALAGRFDELIVDEAQDTSDIQIACLRKLHDTGALTSLVLVADLEQSIYAFQGADPAGCSQLATEANLEELHLTKNFRNSQLICNVAHRFTLRDKPDVADGDHSKCAIAPELLSYSAKQPMGVMEIFEERLEAHGVDAIDSVVLARTRSLQGKLCGAVNLKCNTLVRHLGAVAHARTTGVTVRADQIAAAEATLLWCIDETLHLRDLPPGPEPIVTSYLGGFVREGRTLAHHPGRLLKPRRRFDTTAAASIFSEASTQSGAETVHAVKARSIDAVLLVIEPPTSKRDSASDLLTILTNSTDIVEREGVRIAFVALTRARRYSAIALADTVPHQTVAGYEALGFVLG